MALERPGIMLLGARRSGKSSIARVVYSKMPPHETLFLQPSTDTRVYTIATNPYMQWAVWDWPGDVDWCRNTSSGVAAGTSIPASFVAGSAAEERGGLQSGILLSSSMRGGAGLPRGASSYKDSTALQTQVKVLVFEDPQDEMVDPVVDASGQAVPSTASATQTVSQYDALNSCSAIIFVIDAADEPYTEAFEALRNLAGGLLALAKRKAAAVATSRAAGPTVSSTATGIPGSTPTNPYALPSLEIFLHKIDGDGFNNAGPEARTELLRDVGLQVAQELSEAGFAVSGLPLGVQRPVSSAGVASSPSIGGLVGPVPLAVSFHLTSIYDHSIFEAMSRVVQKVTPGPQLMPSCENLLNGLQQACRAEKVFLFDVVTKLYYATDSSPVQESTYELASEMIEVVVDVGCIYDPIAAAEISNTVDELPRHVKTAADAGRCSTSLIKLANGMAMYMREVAPFLAVVALIRDETSSKAAEDVDAPVLRDTSDVSGEAEASAAYLPHSGLSLSNRALVDYNIRVFARSLANLFAVRFGFAAGVVTDASGIKVPGKRSGSGSFTGSYGGLPLSSSLSRSLGGAGSYMNRHIMGGMGSPSDSSPLRKMDVTR